MSVRSLQVVFLAFLCGLLAPAAFAHGPHRGDSLTLERLGDLDGDGIADIAIVATGDAAGAAAPGETRTEIWIVLLNADGTPKTHQLFEGTLEDLRTHPPAIDSRAAHRRQRPASVTRTKTTEPPSGFAPKDDPIADTPPVALCRDATVSLDFLGEIEITPDLVDAGSYDAEGPITLAVTPAFFTCADVGPNPVTLEVVDSAGQVSICEATVTVVDDTPPLNTPYDTYLHLPETGIATLTVKSLNMNYFDACGIASKTLSQYTFDVCEEGSPWREYLWISVDVTIVDTNGNASVSRAYVNFYSSPGPVVANPRTQSVDYGDLMTPVDVRNNEDPCGSVELFFFSEPFGIDTRSAELTKLDKGVWLLTGQVLVQPRDYSVNLIGIVYDSHIGTTMYFTVLPEEAVVVLADENPSTIPVPVLEETADFSLNAWVTEAESVEDMAGDRDRAGDISLAEVSMTLHPVGPGNLIPGVCTLGDPVPGTPDPGSPFDYDRLPVTAAFEDVPPGTYLVRAEVTGDYYQGSGLDVITVTHGSSENFITGAGHFYWPGTGDGDYPGDRTRFSFKAGFPGASPSTDKGHLRISRRLKSGGVVELESRALGGPVVAAGTEGDPDLLIGTFSGNGALQTAGSQVEDAVNARAEDAAETDVPFVLYVEDGGAEGPDRIWIAASHEQISMADLAASEPPSPNPVLVTRGNIVVHGRGNRTVPTTIDPAALYPRKPAPVLFQNAPNPFTRSTRIAFQIAEGAHTRLSVFDVRGREVARLLDKHLAPGWHETTLRADTLPAGVYFYRIHAGPFTETRRMLLLR